ncbi:MAG TPA: cyclic pyranopterin monophosphate synthase MoaC [Candidatus Omnitrophica bacterium]|nr:MAG: molybdenum cofactor biosynthesis protein C [Omnitrophica WOR_2 bacterium GWA2_53_43]HBO96693.1 cyclic pyranopterin monophosphate synthase MoaC [Candidatus Omnitrophota bacterium]HCI45189.1 cyclic pyranopterin monophosphate synthase MoaC [Candidatus Omnitrophota bacterium]
MKKKRNKRFAGMVDISAKAVTRRVARASARLAMGAKAFRVLMTRGSPKGDVFETARIAGVMAAKSTPAIIPMCHPLELSQVRIAFDPREKDAVIVITSEVVCRGRTGVEMEALTAVCAAALTIYDMMKWADHAMVITEIQLLHKSGGKSGTFNRSG